MNKVESALQRTTDTKALVIGVGTLPRTAEMFNELFPGCRAVVVADTNTWRVAGGEVHRILADAGIGQDEPHVFADPKLYAEWSFVEELDGVLAATDAVPVAVGSGVINDLTKLCSHHNGRRYMVVGTAASTVTRPTEPRSPRTATSRPSTVLRRWAWFSIRRFRRLRPPECRLRATPT